MATTFLEQTRGAWRRQPLLLSPPPPAAPMSYSSSTSRSCTSSSSITAQAAAAAAHSAAAAAAAAAVAAACLSLLRPRTRPTHHANRTARPTPPGLHEDLERLERVIVKDYRSEARGHREKLAQNHRVRKRIDEMQEIARKLVRCSSCAVPCRAALCCAVMLCCCVCRRRVRLRIALRDQLLRCSCSSSVLPLLL